MAQQRKEQPQPNRAARPPQSFADRVREALRERGLLDGVNAALYHAHTTFEDAFGRNDRGRMLRTKAVAHGRACAVAWLYCGSGASLSYPDIERLTGMDQSTARDCVRRVKGVE